MPRTWCTNVFVGLPEALGRYEERGSFASWLKRVTARVALMRLRARTRRREVRIEATLPTAAPPLDSASVALRAAVDALPDPLRAVLRLKESEVYSHAEVGELLGISAGAWRVGRNPAMSRQRKTLEDGRCTGRTGFASCP